MAAGVVFGELDRPFDRVASARSTEYDLAVSAKTVRCDVVKPFDEFDSCLGREVNRMSDFIELLVDSLKHVRLECPTFNTPIPAKKSRNVFPSTSLMVAPLASSIAIGMRRG